jgi:hypothetical protein
MSDISSPPSPPRTPGPPRSGCLTAIMVVIGIVLLLPGLCSLFLVFGGLVKNAEDFQFVIALGVVGCLGAGLIWWAIRGSRS